MIALTRHRSHWARPRRAQPALRVTAAAALIVSLAAAGFETGRALAGPATAVSPIEAIDGIPVGAQHSPVGAVAAADEYVAVAYATVERAPARDLRLIDIVYAPSIRASAIRGAAAVRAQNRIAMRLWARGGQDFSLIGAHRLDDYTGSTAEVTTWNADVLWGPGRSPKQSWVLTQTRLRWSERRWQVTSTMTLPTAGPVPSVTPQASDGATTSVAFTLDLDGFAAPSYGAAE